MKYRKIAAIILALTLVLRPVAAPAQAFADGAPSVCRVIDLGAVDWLGLAAHVSAFAGIAYWIYSGVMEAYDAVSGLEDLWDFISLLLRLGLVPEWYYELAPEPPGAFSI